MHGSAGLRLPAMMLLTGATGTIGSALLRRLTLAGEPVRCPCATRAGSAISACGCRPRWATRRPALVSQRAARCRHGRPPGGLIRDQPLASIEELNALATPAWCARRSGRARDDFCSSRRWGRDTTGARASFAPRPWRSRWRTRRWRRSSFGPSIAYSPGDPWLTLLERFSYLPAIPVSGSGQAIYQPIWAQDVAECVIAALAAREPPRRAFELAGPQISCPTTTSCAWRCARWAPPAPAARAAAGHPCRAARPATRDRAPRSSPGRRRS